MMNKVTGYGVENIASDSGVHGGNFAEVKGAKAIIVARRDATAHPPAPWHNSLRLRGDSRAEWQHLSGTAIDDRS
jgi:hypothetical protein